MKDLNTSSRTDCWQGEGDEGENSAVIVCESYLELQTWTKLLCVSHPVSLDFPESKRLNKPDCTSPWLLLLLHLTVPRLSHQLGASLPSSSSSSSASASYLWPPSKVNVLPQVQINSTLTDQRPPLLLPLSTSTHTSPTTGEIRASLADLTAPLNTAPDRSLIAGSIHCVPPPPPPPPPSLPLAYLCLWPKAASLLCTHLPLLTHVNSHTHTKSSLRPVRRKYLANLLWTVTQQGQ